MKLPDTPAWVIKEQEKSKQSGQITKAIDNQTEVLLPELKRQTDLQGKMLDNQAIKITQLEDLIDETRENGKSSSMEAKRAYRISIVSIVVAILSIIASVLVSLLSRFL